MFQASHNNMYFLTQLLSFLLNTGQLLYMGFKPHQHESKLEKIKFILEKAKFAI